jgi:hypothetical protein
MLRLRRLATLALSLSLATTALISPAAARSFAQAPEAEVADAKPFRIMPDEDRSPRISAAARAKLRKVLRAHRKINVKAFRAYADRGVYPHNYTTNGALNVWIDEEGRMCAAATMIFRSGAKKMVRDVGATDNNIRLGDVSEGPVMDWILTSGLTQDEVAAIQEPFMGRPMPIEPEPGSDDWKLAEDARLRARYTEVLAQLASDPDASIEAAIDRLQFRPDLVAKLLRS